MLLDALNEFVAKGIDSFSGDFDNYKYVNLFENYAFDTAVYYLTVSKEKIVDLNENFKPIIDNKRIADWKSYWS